MIRALIELIIAVLVLIAARAILTSVLKGLLTVGGRAPRQETAAPAGGDPIPPGRELHKDPVCGTYVADSTPFRRQMGGTTFYYCSEECLDQHVVGARR